MIFSVDPGRKGGIGGFRENARGGHDLLLVLKTPLTATGAVDGRKIAELMDTGNRGNVLVIEQGAGRQGEGVTSAFTSGYGFGIYFGIAAALHMDVKIVTAARWKKDMELTKDKQVSLDKAAALWPNLAPTHFRQKNHDGMAEAALLGYWYLQEQE